MIFYINEVHISESDWEHECIGLFDKENWAGEGNFCGWYGAEYYQDTTLIAYGIQLGHSSIYNPKRPFNGGFKVVYKHYDKIPIGSCYWTKSFNANSVEEAIEIFRKQEWEDDR